MNDAVGLSALTDNRREQRYRVYWPARLHLPGADTLDARLKDISENGLGLNTGGALLVGSVLPITMGVPDANGGPQLMAVQCNVRVANVVLAGRDYRIGALWLEPSPSVRQVIDNWVLKLRYSGAVIGTSGWML
jgi:PilZ domain